MALYLKQDFTPPVLSRKWIAMKFRPNMLLYSRQHIISILESGLLFREDSVEVEQETPAASEVRAVAGGSTGWLTTGEKVVSLVAVTGCVAVFPPRSLNRSTLFYLAAYLSLPVAIRFTHRRQCSGTLATLLACMREYLNLARRAAACLKECAALRAQLGSVETVLESVRAMLCRQQSGLAVLMSRASSAVLGNAPWLRGDVAWDAVARDDTDNLMKIHHAFLVVQSTLLKHIAMAHFMPSPHARKVYKNHNERIYWIHHTLIQNLIDEFTQNFEALERMYRLLKNYGNADQNTTKRPGTAINDSWLYSDVHSDIARANLELKCALNKCNNLDTFLDSCALQSQELDLEVLNKDIDGLIENITKCLTTAQSSQIRLKKLMSKFGTQAPVVENETESIEDEKYILKIEDREPETKDEVFYFIKTEDDIPTVQQSGDVTTGPGKKEKDATKIVMNELKRKLVNREDVMRERERQALAKTMPELKDNVPEFPRQIKIEEVLERKGYIRKIQRDVPRKRLFRKYKIQPRRLPYSNFKTIYRLNMRKYEKESDIPSPSYEANSKLNTKSKMLTFLEWKKFTFITQWRKCVDNDLEPIIIDYSDLSEGLSDVEASAVNNYINQAVNLNNNFEEKENGDARNYKFSKKELELSPSSSDESDLDLYKGRQMAHLKDLRKHRASRKKNYPDKRAHISGPSTQTDQDESLKPTQYSLGAGLAMASVLQGGRLPPPALAIREDIFVGAGEVSDDSGNDDQ